MGAPLMLLMLWLLARTRKRLEEIEDKKRLGRRVRYGAVVSFLFSITMIAGYQLQNFGMTGLGVKGKVLILLRSACLAIAVFPFTDILFCAVEKIPVHRTKQKRQLESLEGVLSQRGAHFPMPDSCMAGILSDYHVL